MKNCLLFVISLIVCACSNSQQKSNRQSNSIDQTESNPLELTKNQTKHSQIITFRDTKGKAVLIGDKIELLDVDLNPIEDISNLSEQIIEIDAVSDSMILFENDICGAYWYVKVTIGQRRGVVNGRHVFKIVDSKQDTSIVINGNKFEILTTEFFGMGVVYQGELMGCPVDQPILIIDDSKNYFGLVDVVPNEISAKANWNHEFKYFELSDDDGAYDRIESIIPKDSTVLLKVHRNYQDGENYYEVMLRYSQGSYTAEYLNFGEIRYE